jgi:hypothetical protein
LSLEDLASGRRLGFICPCSGAGHPTICIQKLLEYFLFSFFL